MSYLQASYLTLEDTMHASAFTTVFISGCLAVACGTESSADGASDPTQSSEPEVRTARCPDDVSSLEFSSFRSASRLSGFAKKAAATFSSANGYITQPGTIDKKARGVCTYGSEPGGTGAMTGRL